MLMEKLWDACEADSLLTRAATVIEELAGGELRSDSIRIRPFTERLIQHIESRPNIALG